MQNVVYVYNDFGNNREEVVYYNEIYSEFDRPSQYPKDGFLNIRLTSHTESLFDLEVDIYCIYKDKAYLFSFDRLPLKSDVILDFDEFRNELINYLKVYLKYKQVQMSNEYVNFQFKHNLNIEITSKRIVNFYKKYAKGGLWSVEISSTVYKTDYDKFERLRLLDDFLKCLLSLKNQNEKLVFFLSSLIYLPFDMILHVVPLVIPHDHDKKVFFYYKLSEIMISRCKYNLGYLYSIQVVTELKRTLNIKMAEYFLKRNRSIRINDNWNKVLNEVIEILETENKRTFGDVIWERPYVDKQDLTITNISVVSSNPIFVKQDDCSDIFNRKKDPNVCLESLRVELEASSDAYLKEIILENILDGYVLDGEIMDNEISLEEITDEKTIDKHARLPVYRNINTGKNTFVLPVCFQEGFTSFKIKELVFKNHKSHFITPIVFNQIKRNYTIQLKDYFVDENNVIYNFMIDKARRIFTFFLMKSDKEMLISFPKDTKKILLYEITDKYVEQIDLN